MYRAPKPQYQPVSQDIKIGLTERVSLISSAGIEPVKDIAFKNPRLVGGYNWIDDDEPSIAVPGLPNVWIKDTPRLGQLRPDIEIPGYMEYADQNGARLIPSGISRFDPILYALDSPIDLLGAQVVTDRNCLRKIYSIFNPTAVYGTKPFRMDAQKVGNVIMFTRNEAADKRYAEKPHPFCYSKSHELATMRSQLKDSTSCHRLIRYEFGGIDMIVRFELDAVTQAGAVPEIKTRSTTSKSLEDAISGMTMGNNDRQIQLPKHFESKAGIKVYRTSYPPAPLASFIEKKTRTANGQLDYIDIYGQLVFSQTPHLYVARHNRGNFQDLEQVSLGSGKLAKIAKDTEGVMGKVAGMLAEMMEVVHEFGEVSFVWSGQGGMVEVWKGEVQAELSGEAKEMLLAA